MLKRSFFFFFGRFAKFLFFYSIPSFSFFVFSTKQNKKCTETVVEAKLEKKIGRKIFQELCLLSSFPGELEAVENSEHVHGHWG